MKDGMEQAGLTAIAGEELERELRTYASARLSPDRFASHRMRTAVMEHALAAMPAGLMAPPPHRLDVLSALRVGTRRLAPFALVAALAVGAGSAAGAAAMPGGPLYPVRVWVETAFLPAGGEARADAQQALLNERIDEISGALDAGDKGAAEAASNAFDQEVGQALTQAAQDRVTLLELRETVARHLARLQGLVKPNDKAGAQLQRLITTTRATLAAIDARIAALPTPAP
ncbi:MAG TPA: DUF5667 domain-containing protein [Candidatus Limnocylindrales bacterium]